jgi:hypothetical protein
VFIAETYTAGTAEALPPGGGHPIGSYALQGRGSGVAAVHPNAVSALAVVVHRMRRHGVDDDNGVVLVRVLDADDPCIDIRVRIPFSHRRFLGSKERRRFHEYTLPGNALVGEYRAAVSYGAAHGLTRRDAHRLIARDSPLPADSSVEGSPRIPVTRPRTRGRTRRSSCYRPGDDLGIGVHQSHHGLRPRRPDGSRARIVRLGRPALRRAVRWSTTEIPYTRPDIATNEPAGDRQS